MIRTGTFDPAPSRLRYRIERVWYSPTFRRFAKIGIPLAIVLVPVALFLQVRDFRDQVTSMAAVAADAASEFSRLPEFQIVDVDVVGASGDVELKVRQIIEYELPGTSLGLDVDGLRHGILRVPAIESATLFIRPGGVLDVRIVERTPVAVWRHDFGLALIDGEGRRIGSLDSRHQRRDLPLVVGEGAPDAIDEALQLREVAGPLRSRIRGLRRVGERRWDLVLDRSQTISLPESAPAEALARIVELHERHRLLDRYVTVVDYRLPGRPVLRVEPGRFKPLDEAGNGSGQFAGRNLSSGGT